MKNLDQRILIQDDSLIIGKFLAKSIRENMPFKATDLDNNLIKRGNKVTVNYAYKNMGIKIIGKALENGGLGDVVKIQNMKTNQVFDAIVTGKNLLELE